MCYSQSPSLASQLVHLVDINGHIGQTRRQISRLDVDAEIASGANLKPPKRHDVLLLMWGMWRAHVRVSRADRATRKISEAVVEERDRRAAGRLVGSEAPRAAAGKLSSARRQHRVRLRKAADRELIKHAMWERTRADTCGGGLSSTSRKHCAIEAAGQLSVQASSPPRPSGAITPVAPKRPSSAPSYKAKSPVVTVRATTRSTIRPHSATERHAAEQIDDDYRSDLLFDLGRGPLGLTLAVRSTVSCTDSLAELTACTCTGWLEHRRS